MSDADVSLLDACRSVMSEPDVMRRYPYGLTPREILKEIRARHGADAFPFVSTIDVAEEMRSFYGAAS